MFGKTQGRWGDGESLMSQRNVKKSGEVHEASVCGLNEEGTEVQTPESEVPGKGPSGLGKRL